jgi:hypothetical protein
MIRDPSDGSVREDKFRSGLVPGMEAGNEGVSERHRPPQAHRIVPCTGNAAQPASIEFSGLRAGSTKPENIARLEKSREWLKNYHESRLNPEAVTEEKES